MEMKKRIGLALRDLRAVYRVDGHALSQQEVADLAQISARYYHDLENGTRMPSIDVFEKVAHAFNLPLSELCKKVEEIK